MKRFFGRKVLRALKRPMTICAGNWRFSLALLPCSGEEVPMPGEFSRKYSLMGSDPQRVRDVFSPDVTSHLLDHRRFQIEGVGDTLIVCWPGRLPEAKKIKPFLDEVIALPGLFEAAARRD